MRLVSWNCATGLSGKHDAFALLSSDVAVLPESSQADIDAFNSEGASAFFVGDNSSKGLGVYARPGWKLCPIENHTPDSKWVAAFEVTGGVPFTLVAVWTVGKGLKQYARILNQALLANPQWFAHGPVVVMGDFNANSKWDRTCGSVNHSANVSLLTSFGLQSCYHESANEEQGKETKPTYYHRRKINDPFHIDYVFASAQWLAKMDSVEVGSFEQWGKLSDHCPITIEIQI